MLASSADLFICCHHAIFGDFFAMYSIGHDINSLERVCVRCPVLVQLDIVAAVTKPPPSASHIYRFKWESVILM